MALQQDQEIAMLRAELEGLMHERANLMHTVGAAAVFVANMDSKNLPEEAFEAAEMLAASLNRLDEECLREALDSVHTADGATEAGKSN
jgi:hypothetical protein